MRYLALYLLALFLSACSSNPSDGASVYRAYASGVVLITTYQDPGGTLQLGVGSGFIVDKETGTIATAAHVVDSPALVILVTYPDGTITRATVLDKSNLDPKTRPDVAFIIPDVAPSLPSACLPLDITSNPPPGTLLWTLGYPMGAGLNITPAFALGPPGINRVLDETVGFNSLLRISGMIVEGNSGGPIVSDAGVIAIAVITVKREGGYVSIGYGTPSILVHRAFWALYSRAPSCA